MLRNFPDDPLYGLEPMLSQVDILVVDILVVIEWGVPPWETQQDIGDEVVDVVAEFGVRVLVVLNHPTTPHRDSK